MRDASTMKILIDRGLPTWRGLPQILVFFLVLPPRAYGQQPAPPPAKRMAPLPIVQNLKVLPLAGNDGLNDLERHTVAPLVVQVLDQNDRPVEGADVVFRFPLKGPGASFADQKTSQTMRTNSQGQAAATGWTANNAVGPFQVHATATYGNKWGRKTIE